MIGEEPRQAVMRGVGLGDDQQPARILVDAMHDAGLLHPADAGKTVAAMGDQRIDQRAALMRARRMHDEPGWLVDDEKMRSPHRRS